MLGSRATRTGVLRAWPEEIVMILRPTGSCVGLHDFGRSVGGRHRTDRGGFRVKSEHVDKILVIVRLLLFQLVAREGLVGRSPCRPKICSRSPRRTPCCSSW